MCCRKECNRKLKNTNKRENNEIMDKTKLGRTTKYLKGQRLEELDNEQDTVWA
jgi:hypothetical protein